MHRTRPLALFALVLAALFAAGCGSNNKGKIVGKWKLDTLPVTDPKKAEMIKALGVYGYLDFRADGTLVMGADSEKPGVMELAKLGNPNARTSAQTTYKLLSGNMVEIADTPGLGANSTGHDPRRPRRGRHRRRPDDSQDVRGEVAHAHPDAGRSPARGQGQGHGQRPTVTSPTPTRLHSHLPQELP